MSSQFRPLEIPPGVTSAGTRNQRSSNWFEVNLMRWREGQLMPMGGQSQYSNVVGGVEKYVFASKCKKIHGWFDATGVYRIAYLCETNIYIDTGGTLTDVTPAGGMAPPAGVSGGYGDGLYSPDAPATSLYGRPPPVTPSVAVTKVPDAYSLDNFGSILYAMTSSDQRLLMWDPGVGGPAIVQPASSAAARCRMAAASSSRPSDSSLFSVRTTTARPAARRRLRAPLRLVRPGEPGRLGLFERHQPGGLPRHRTGEPDHRGDIDARRHPLLDRQEGRTHHASWDCPTSTITSSSATARRLGRRSRCRPPRA